MLLNKIKELLGEELANQVEEKLKGKGKDGKDIELGVSNDGSLCPSDKLEEERKLRTAAETRVNELDTQIKKLDVEGKDKEITELKKDRDTIQTKYDTDIAAIKMDHAIERAITQSGGKNATAIKALISNRDSLKIKDDGSVEGLDLTAIKESDPYLFDVVENKIAGDPPASGGISTPGGEKDPDKMSYVEYVAWRSKGQT